MRGAVTGTPIDGMPRVFTYALVDLVRQDAKLTKRAARKVIVRGSVAVNGKVVRDPDARVDATALIECWP